MTLLIWLAAFSSIYLARFGLQITEDFSISPSYIFLYLSVLFGLKNRYLEFCARSMIWYALFCFTGLLSYLNATDSKSLSSLFLLFFTYFPLVLGQRLPVLTFACFSRLYLTLIIICCICGILQFCMQFLIKPVWLFDFREFIPSFFQNKNISNTVIPIAFFYKANGFFLTEPSGFSQWCTWGLFFSNSIHAFHLYYFVFLFGLILSFSGTGLIMFFVFSCAQILVGSFFQKVLGASLLCVLVLVFLFFVPEFIQDRAKEFQGGTSLVTTSAAARFVNPLVVITDSLNSSLKTFMIGNGPGSIGRVVRDFEAHDPTYAKLIFEYGILGFLLYFPLIRQFFSFRRFFLFSFLLFIQIFFLGGNLLALNNLVLPLIFALFTKK